MNPVDTAPHVVEQWPEPPRLLVEWSSPWEEFRTALGPALSRAPKALAGEARTGIFPYRGMLACWLLECLLLIAVIVLPERIASLHPYQPPPLPKWDVIYYSGDELPQTQDRGGAEAGVSGRAGGQEAYHRTQTIRVARGDRPTEKIVDAPKLDLPRSDSSVANLLAFRPLAGPPPAEGLRSTLTVPPLPNSGVVAPAPELNSAASRRPDELQTSIVAPAPEVSHTNLRTAPAFSAPVVAPAPNITSDKMRSAGTMSQTIIAPPPSDAQRDLASSRSSLTRTTDVVAPPVSAPARAVSAAGKLTLPTPAVVAPPPSQVSRDLNSWGGSATGNIRTNPVPPPPSTAGGGASLSRGNVGALASQVVPPPPSPAGSGGTSLGGVGTLGTQVVPPPVSGASLGPGERAGGRSGGALLGAANVVPPPPSVGGGKALSGSGRGNKGAGAGGPLDLGSAVAPPTNSGGNAPGSGVVMSSQPGTKVGVPNATGGGAIAMSPSGTAKTGIGGSGGGAGIGKGNGPGSGMKGEGSGAGRAGSGRGSDPNARGGISPYPGSGGAGSGTTGSPAVPGVSVEGGTTTITLPSFGGPGENSPPGGPGHSSIKGHQGTGVTVVATSRSGGVFNYYGVLKGNRVYSMYMQTSMGAAVMEYSDPESAVHPYSEDLATPEPMRMDLPAGLRPTHVVFVGILDRSGVLKNLKVLEPGAADTTSKLLVALRNWKFRPAFHGEEPVEVTAILGFGVDTR